jgi:hypothetical protein
MSLTTMLVVVPTFSAFLARSLHYDAIKKDMCITRVAAAAGVVGYFLVFIASSASLFLTGLVFMTFSIPFVYSVISLATSFVGSKNQVATLYAAMSVARSVGNMSSGPIFAALYGVGMRMGLQWSGLPFAVGSLILMVTLIPLFCMRMPSAREN